MGVRLLFSTPGEDLVSTERTEKQFHNLNLAFLQTAWKIGEPCPQVIKSGPSLELATCSTGAKPSQQRCNFPAIYQSCKSSGFPKSMGARPRPLPPPSLPLPGKLGACACPAATTAWWRQCPPHPFHPLSPLFRIPLSNSIRAELASSSCSP